MPRKWEHDGKDMKSAPMLPGERDFDWGKIKHTHYMAGDGPYEGSRYDRIWTGVAGRHCIRKGCPQRDAHPICSYGLVATRVGRSTDFSRCAAPGIVLRDACPWSAPTDPRCPPRTVTPDGAGWYYCKTHDPVAVKAKADARDAIWAAERATRERKADTEADLLDAADDWYVDELATEGFCAPDTACEHHECRLARAVEAYRDARQSSG